MKQVFRLGALTLIFAAISFSQIVRVDEIEGRSDPRLNRERGKTMLKEIKEILEQHYYDKSFKGIDLDKRFKETEEKLKTLDTNAQIFRQIASVLMEFDDSHTRFFPPGRSNRVEYGFAMQVIGNNCFVVDVKKGSNAEKQGLKVGDVIQKIGQYDVNRSNLWALNYFIYQLEPLPLLPLTITNSSGGREIGIEATFKPFAERMKEDAARRKEKQEDPYKCAKLSNDLIACRLKTFSVDKKFIDKMMKEAVGSSSMILDLRGNRGGFVKMNEYLTGHFFENEVKIGDLVYRNKKRTSTAKPQKERAFRGKLSVLVDSNSASASEVFARLIQIEKRGQIIGDVTAGAVMTSYSMSLALSRGAAGFQTFTPYGLNVTVADLIMSDGGRLEKTGVSPDLAIGPTSEALAMRTDPVLAHAASLFGVNITPQEAGKLEFLFKQPEHADDEESDEAEPQ